MWNTNELISNYVFTEKRTGEIASPTISIIFVELERFTKRLDECTGELDQLLYLSGKQETKLRTEYDART